MAFDDNDESSKKQKEPRVKNKVSHKGKHKAFGYEDLSIENLGQCDEDPSETITMTKHKIHIMKKSKS